MTAATGLIYPFALDLLCEVPKADFDRYAVSIDYGTVNPTSMGLWGLLVRRVVPRRRVLL